MKLSIITINLNNITGLQKTIQSVITQSFKDFEFIIIDGGSSDESVVTIKRNASRITRWISEKDNGIYHALNKGIGMAQGDYLLFLHSGDKLIGSNILKEVFGAKHHEEILFGDVRYYDPFLKRDIETGLPNDLDLFFFYKQSLWHQASFIKKSLFEKFGNYNENNRYISDWEFFLDAIVFEKVSYKNLNQVVIYYDMYNGISIKQKEESEIEKMIVLKSRITEPVYELLTRMDNVLTELQEIYKSDSFKVYKWLNKHRTIIKIMMLIYKVIILPLKK